MLHLYVFLGGTISAMQCQSSACYHGLLASAVKLGHFFSGLVFLFSWHLNFLNVADFRCF